MILRTAKVLLVLAVALYYTIIVFNNITDYNSDYQFVRHVLMMDSTFPGNRGMWRALNSPVWHTAFYLSIIAWEALTMVLCWWGGWRGNCERRPRHFTRRRAWQCQRWP